MIIAVSSTYWTSAVAEALENGTLKDYLGICNQQIDNTVTLVRGKLPSMARITLGALIVIDVHGRIYLLSCTHILSMLHYCINTVTGCTYLHMYILYLINSSRCFTENVY